MIEAHNWLNKVDDGILFLGVHNSNLTKKHMIQTKYEAIAKDIQEKLNKPYDPYLELDFEKIISAKFVKLSSRSEDWDFKVNSSKNRSRGLDWKTQTFFRRYESGEVEKDIRFDQIVEKILNNEDDLVEIVVWGCSKEDWDKLVEYKRKFDQYLNDQLKNMP